MNLDEAEDKILDYFRRNGFSISEWPNIHPSLEWRPRARVTRVIRSRTSDAAIVVREDGSSYKQGYNWFPLVEARRQLPNLSIYFAIPDNTRQEPLKQELRELGIGLYTISTNGVPNRVQNDRVPFEDTAISYPIDPNLPFRNRINLWKVFSNCKSYLWWLDKHFRLDGFILLEDWCHCGPPCVTEIRILGSNLVGSQELTRLQHNFPPFQAELNNLGISVELRILHDPTILRTLHDRYIIAENIAFNILPVGSLILGQQGSLYLEENPPDFESLWAEGRIL
jgi:hypothetical protein